MVSDVATADTNAQATVAVAAEANMAWPARLGRFLAAWVIARQGDPGRGADQMEAGFRKLQEMNQRLYLTFLGTLLANAKLEMGRTEDALNYLEELLFLVKTHQQLFIPDLHRLRAEALRRLDPRGPRIEAEYRMALQLAREQGALALELRAAGGLATFLAASGRTSEGAARAASGVRPLHRRPGDAGSAGRQGAARCFRLGVLMHRGAVPLLPQLQLPTEVASGRRRVGNGSDARSVSRRRVRDSGRMTAFGPERRFANVRLRAASGVLADIGQASRFMGTTARIAGQLPALYDPL